MPVAPNNINEAYRVSQWNMDNESEPIKEAANP